MTIRRIKTFLAKWPDDQPKPAAVVMLAYLLDLFEKDADDRVDALLKAMLEDEQTYRSQLHQHQQWLVDELNQFKRTAGSCGVTDDLPNKPVRRRSKLVTCG